MLSIFLHDYPVKSAHSIIYLRYDPIHQKSDKQKYNPPFRNGGVFVIFKEPKILEA